jgi:ADP-heptose:LPS heptosyltransferase/GT2 family glycosyltransferase
MTSTLESLRLQAYPDWSVVVIAETEDAANAMRVLLVATLPHLLARFTIITSSDRAAWTAPLVGSDTNEATVLYGLLGPGDELGADALLEFAVAGAIHGACDLLYGDEVRPSPVNEDREQFFKPDYSPDLLLATNYIGRPWVVTAPILAQTGVSPASLVADGEYDLVLRCTELAGRIHHIPKLLSQRVASELDAPAQEEAALNAALRRSGIDGEILPAAVRGTWRLKRRHSSRGKVSIIIPTCAAHGYIETCLNTLRDRTAYSDYEIIVIDNIPETQLAWKVWVQQNADKVVEIADTFNWSVFNNRAVDVADGEYLLFLNDDIEITQSDWLDAMLEHAQRPEVGVTGARLLYPDGKVQHAGMFLANNGIGRHAFRFAAPDDPGYFGLALTQRNVMAVTGACLLVRRETFDRLGRFDEAHQIVNNDLDFCLRVHRAGLLTVITPYATLTHHELASRANLKDVFNASRFDSSWKTQFAAGDPYFNPRLSRHSDDYRPDDEPVQWVTPGAPVFHAQDIERILVVKLDHIGDFVTALPPIRRLKHLFPHASITVLAGPASRAFVPLEPAIDAFIPFAFFHARSQLGERQLDQQEYVALREQLRPYRFDLAVDLRKHTSTRDVLKYTGARFLAGYDYLGQFPFLDIALDWDGDRTLQRKRSHIIDDLLALVDAIGHAGESDRLPMQPTPDAMPLEALPPEVQALFARTVVAIHPGAGNVTKQWPTEHFSALIDLLVERHNVNILLIGGPDEVAVVDDLLTRTLHPSALASMAGKTSLADLPRLLLRCALYIGNDSGPKHIAAAVGIPTIGVHSGVVDPVEWGPIGPRAVALRRNMTCSPCYLANAEDCPRSLACLRLLEPNLVYEAARMLLPPQAHLPEQQRVTPDRPEEQESPSVVTPVPERVPARKTSRRQRSPQPAE